MGEEIVLEDALELLADPIAVAILRQLSDRPRSATAVSRESEWGRETVYRRLAELEAAGIVRADVELSTSGPHRHVYYNVLDEIAGSIVADAANSTGVGQPR